jgi:NCAIR mutase (PurE)-related protein
MTLRDLLDGLKEGAISVDEAERFLSTWGFIQIGHQRFDTAREGRTATPEVVYGAGKTTEQLVELVSHFDGEGLALLITKVDVALGEELAGSMPRLSYDRTSRLLRMGSSVSPAEGRVAVITAGSSDVGVAEEAAGTLDFFGVEVARAYDCGVAGLHRLFAAAEEVSSCDVAIVVAGMDGALPSVVGGIFRAPIIAVPTSVGYGAAFEGLAALLTMLNSCAAGVTVVNIDNGFGAAVAARAVLDLAARRSARTDRARLQLKAQEVT